MTRIACLAALLLVLAAACDRAPPPPVVDRSIERGTALPPPGLEPRAGR